MPGSWLASQGRLPLAFMGLGLLWLAAAAGLLAAAPGVLAMPHVHPHVIALTHAWVLGFFVTVACGAIYQLAPVALGTTLWSERSGWAHLALHALGVPGMVVAFWRWDLRLLGCFSPLVAIGVGFFAVNAWVTVRKSGRRDAVAWSLVLAPAWLVLTVLAGLALAANRVWYFIPADPIALLRAHAHLGLIGFFATLLQGVTFRLVPMFTLGDVPDWRPVKAGLWITQTALLVLVSALAYHLALLTCVMAGLILISFGCSAHGLVRTLATRKKRKLDPGVVIFLVGLGGMVFSALVGFVLALPAVPGGSAAGGFNAMVYGILLFAGGLLPAISGMMCKIVPFLTWMRAYGPKVGRAATPPAGSLARPWLHRTGLLVQLLAVLPLVAGAWLENLALLRAGAWLLAIGVALLLIDLGGVLRHLWLPVDAPLFPGRAAPAKGVSS